VHGPSGDSLLMSLLDPSPVYKPFRYPWAYDAWLQQQRIHWLPEEIPLADDVKDWQRNLSDGERNLLTQIFRFFTQSDVEVNNCYMAVAPRWMPSWRTTTWRTRFPPGPP